jgi:hypothetical protein
VQHARRLFDQAHARTLGVVFNKITAQVGEGYYYYRRSYYGEETRALRNGKSPATNGANGNGHHPAALEPAPEEQVKQ